MLRISAYMYTVTRESASTREKFDVYIGNFGNNNGKGKIKMQCRINLKFCVMSSNNPVTC